MRVVDLFCGAGGTSTGAMRAIHEFGDQCDFVAVNHNADSIATHAENHPAARHYCVNLDAVSPEVLVPDGELDLLLASPECRFHSRALGGKPINDQSRASAWHVPRWAERLYIRRIVVENVMEFADWAPLGANGRPLKSKKGDVFRAWVAALESLGYRVEARVLNAADYGDATTRQRLFVQARRDNRRIVWPAATHSRDGSNLFGAGAQKWRSARSIIDWDLVGSDIFERARDLSPKTMARITAGIRRFNTDGVSTAFLEVIRRFADPAAPVDDSPRAIAEAQFAPMVCANRTNNVPKSVNAPLGTATTTTGGGFFLIDGGAFVLGQQSDAAPRSVEQPLPTVSTAGAISVIEPFIVPQRNDAGPRSTEDPMPTITTTSRGIGIAEPFISVYHGDKNGLPRAAASVDDPLATIATAKHFAVVEPIAQPFLVAYDRNADGAPYRALDVHAPMPTIVTRDRFGVAEPFMVAHFGERAGQPPRTHDLDEPVPTVTSRGAAELVEPILRPATDAIDPRRIVRGDDGKLYALYIRFRMLQPHELAAAMGFPAGYHFAGTKESRTRQIGNAVPVNLAHALVRAALYDSASPLALDESDVA